MSFNQRTRAFDRWPISVENATYSKVTWRIIPFLFLCYVVAYLDRVNVGFAKLQMLTELQFSDATYGLGAGIFFIGYFIFEVPSNVILTKVGARRWLARIMVTWGVVSGVTAFVTTPAMFYTMRFLLGITEAGFLPGVIFYLTYWYPAHRRGRINAIFMSAVAFSGVVGAPASGFILEAMSGVHGLSGWQWLFLLEAVPSIALGIVMVFYLSDEISDADWLTAEEKSLLQHQVEQESRQRTDNGAIRALLDRRVWLLSAVGFCIVMGVYGVSFWLPTIIRSTGVSSPATIGILTGVPYAFAVVSMLATSWSADKRGERRWHVAIPAALAAIGLVASVRYSGSTALALSALTLSISGIFTCIALFWSLPTAFLGGISAAAGIALINATSNLAGFVAPYMVGWIKDTTHSTNTGMLVISGFLFVGSLMTLAIPKTLVR